MRILLISLLFFKAHSLDLANPQMLSLMLKYKQSNLNKNTCHSSTDSSTKKTFKNRESFNATVRCQIKCVDEAEMTLSDKSLFRPRSLSLTPGNGSYKETILWQSLAVTIDIFKKQKCYDLALKQCKQDDKISSLKALSIKSGDWLLSEDLTCATAKVIKSPFDNEFAIESDFEPLLETEFIPQYDFGLSITPEEKTLNQMQEFALSTIQVEEMLKLKDCKRVVSIATCSGDCVYKNDEAYIETLATPKPSLKSHFSICIDSQYGKLPLKSKAVSSFKCEKLVWEFLRASKTGEERCAALRYSSDCNKLFI